MKAILYYDYLNLVKNKKIIYWTLAAVILFGMQIEIQFAFMGIGNLSTLNLCAPLIVWCVTVIPVIGYGRKDFDNSLLDLYNQKSTSLIGLYIARTIIPIISSSIVLFIYSMFWYYAFSIPIAYIFSVETLTLLICGISLSFLVTVMILMVMYNNPENDILITAMSIVPLLFYMIVPMLLSKYTSTDSKFIVPILLIAIGLLLSIVFSRILKHKYVDTLKNINNA